MNKPGWLTSEFAATVATQIVAVLVLLGVIAPGDRETIQGAALNIVAALGAIVGAAAVLWKYIQSRTTIKTMAAAPQAALVGAIHPGAYAKAMAAGVPWLTILVWAIQYGPQLKELIDQLIAGFKRDRP